MDYQPRKSRCRRNLTVIGVGHAAALLFSRSSGNTQRGMATSTRLSTVTFNVTNFAKLDLRRHRSSRMVIRSTTEPSVTEPKFSAAALGAALFWPPSPFLSGCTLAR
jgi:hypothetical protein